MADNTPTHTNIADWLRNPLLRKWRFTGWTFARYADSHGYQDDNIRTQCHGAIAIHANENMPYDKFISWQLP
jgi:hypothetical protein